MAAPEKDQWLTMVRPLLSCIRASAFWVKHYSKEIADKVEMLPYRPSFETEAQSEIDEAVKAVDKAKEALLAARVAYVQKKVG